MVAWTRVGAEEIGRHDRGKKCGGSGVTALWVQPLLTAELPKREMEGGLPEGGGFPPAGGCSTRESREGTARNHMGMHGQGGQEMKG